MKLLHTADWHIGAKWEGVDRAEDLLGRAIPDMVEIALAEKVNMLLVAGDIFERQTTDSVQMAAQTMREPFKELLAAQMEVLLLVGNHDSAPLFRFLRSAIDLLDSRDNGRGRLHVLNSAWVTLVEGLQVVHLPYLRGEQIERALQSKASDLPESVEMANWQLGRQLDQIARTLRQRLDPRQPALMTFHGVVQGSTIGAEEQSYEFTYRQDYMLSPDSLLFNDQVPQYNALGHIHRCQELAGAVPTWYAGSLDRMNRGEKDYGPSVMLVEFPENGRRVEFEHRQLPRPTPFLNERIGSQAELDALRDSLGEERCKRALGRIELTYDPADSFTLDQAVRDAFPRLRGVKRAVLRPRNVTQGLGSEAQVSEVRELVNPAYTIRKYVAENVPAEQREGLLAALAAVEDALSHDH